MIQRPEHESLVGTTYAKYTKYKYITYSKLVYLRFLRCVLGLDGFNYYKNNHPILKLSLKSSSLCCLTSNFSLLQLH